MEDIPIKLSPSDDGTPYHASYHGGPTFPRVTVQLIFWGSAWPNPYSGPSASEVTAATQSMLSGPYLSGLLQYGVYLGALRGATFVSADPPNPLSKDDWHNKIWDLIDDGTFPEPDDPGGGNLYMLILPPDTVYDEPGVGGTHGSPWDYDPPFDVDFAYAGFVLNPGNLDGLMNRLSHEIVEACTDAAGNRNEAWTLDGLSHPHSEICDVCVNTAAPVNGVSMQGYWSNFDKGCIVPTVFSLRRFMLMKGLDPAKGLAVIVPPVKSVLDFILAG
jgi:hypothetical protein